MSAPATSSAGDLDRFPAEVRNLIYEYAMIDAFASRRAFASLFTRPGEDRYRRIWKPKFCDFVCHKIRRESLPMFLAWNLYDVYIAKLDIRSLKNALFSIGKANVTCQGRLHINLLYFDDDRMRPTLEVMLKFTQFCAAFALRCTETPEFGTAAIKWASEERGVTAIGEGWADPVHPENKGWLQVDRRLLNTLAGCGRALYFSKERSQPEVAVSAFLDTIIANCGPRVPADSARDHDFTSQLVQIIVGGGWVSLKDKLVKQWTADMRYFVD